MGLEGLDQTQLNLLNPLELLNIFHRAKQTNLPPAIQHHGVGWTCTGLSSFDFLAKKQYYVPGVQLFTLIALIDQDMQGTLKKLAGIGY